MKHQLRASFILAAVTPALGCAGRASPPARAPTSAAAAETFAPPETMPAEMAPLAFYVGRWTCKGTQRDADGNAVKTYDDLTVEVSPHLDGSWLQVVVLDGGKPATRELKGYDVQDKKFHHIWAAPGQWGSLTSDGWDGDHMIFVEDATPAGNSPQRMIFTKDSDRHYRHQAEAWGSDEAWHVMFEKDCTKQG